MQSNDGKGPNTHLFPQLRKMTGSGPARWQTAAIQKFLSDAVPKEEKKKVTAKSSRIGSITEMGAMNVGFYPSHARSGHTVMCDFRRRDFESASKLGEAATSSARFRTLVRRMSRTFQKARPARAVRRPGVVRSSRATRGRCAATFWKVPAAPESEIFL